MSIKNIKSRIENVATRFRQDRNAAVAIEFGMLAVPFAVVMFAILESCVSFAAQQVMSNATDDVARQIRTGQFKRADINETTLKTAICNQLQLVMVGSTCDGLVVDLRSYTNFSDAAAERIRISGGDLDTTGFDVAPGGALTRNMLRVFYKWPVITDFMSYKMSNLNDYKTLLFATATWKNEPFDE